MNALLREKLGRLWAALQLQTPDSTAVVTRVLPLERNIALPARFVVVLILYCSLYFSPWISWVSSSLEVGVETVTSIYWAYVMGSVVLSVVLVAAQYLPTTLVRWAVLCQWLLDGVFLAGLTLITGGYDSFSYWLFVVLIVRTTIMEPASATQLIVNSFTTGCYVIAGLTDFTLADTLEDQPPRSGAGEVLFVRAVLLELVAVCGFGVQLLLERQQAAEAEVHEHRVREDRLRSAGRLAAEIAHQLKNPLAIINNTTFSLQRAIQSDDPKVLQCAEVIREEIARADQILTQVMGYAHLNEGIIEKLNVAATLEEAIQVVFPEGAEFPVSVERHYPSKPPAVLMQKAHLLGILVNLLTNAREACPNPGRIRLDISQEHADGIEIAIHDNGPGIPKELHGRIFESHYTTKDSGTGLGLSIVKNNAELYGGTVRVESELGKGARFILVFPTAASAPVQP